MKIKISKKLPALSVKANKVHKIITIFMLDVINKDEENALIGKNNRNLTSDYNLS